MLSLLLLSTCSVVSALQCGGTAQYECLPGVDALGVGFDAVFGSQALGVGRQVINFSYTNPSNTYRDPFGNSTVYSYPDQAHVTQSTNQFFGHNVYRSVNDYAKSQEISTRASAGFGGFFKASVETKNAESIMSDGLHIIAESKAEVGVYTVTLDPSLLMQPSSKFAAYVNLLPENYDENAYAQFVNDWGTHYISAATFGGVATMHTTISQSYYGYHSDSAIQANLKVMWGLFGGGGGGGSSSNATDQEWQSGSTSYTTTSGGDPSIRSFNSSDEWSQWAKSVVTGSPIITRYALELISEAVPAGAKQANVQQAVMAYTTAHNTTFSPASLVNVSMGWCDCYPENLQSQQPCTSHSDWTCAQLACTQQGFFPTNFNLNQDEGSGFYFEGDAQPTMMTCCRPCFAASN